MQHLSYPLHNVNLGQSRPMTVNGRTLQSAIGKRSVQGVVAVGRMGLVGDEQADLSVHGGLDKAVYAYPGEHYGFWQAQRRERAVSLFDEALPPGFMGENLTISGLLEDAVWVGDVLRFPACVLRVSAPREPCGKFNAVMGFTLAAREMVLRGYSGFYCEVLETGSLSAGQNFALVPGPRALSVAQALAMRRFKHLR
jgi:MOSC domain-containing protein YiiM